MVFHRLELMVIMLLIVLELVLDFEQVGWMQLEFLDIQRSFEWNDLVVVLQQSYSLQVTSLPLQVYGLVWKFVLVQLVLFVMFGVE